MTYRIISALLCFALLLISCGDDDPTTQELNQLDAQVGQSMEDMLTQYCVCYADTFYGGAMNACLRDQRAQLGIVDEVSSCDRDVARCYQEDYMTLGRCVENAARRLEQCLTNCPVGGTFENCINTFNQTLVTCRQNAPPKLSAAQRSCVAGEKFVCDD